MGCANSADDESCGLIHDTRVLDTFRLATHLLPRDATEEATMDSWHHQVMMMLDERPHKMLAVVDFLGGKVQFHSLDAKLRLKAQITEFWKQPEKEKDKKRDPAKEDLPSVVCCVPTKWSLNSIVVGDQHSKIRVVDGCDLSKVHRTILGQRVGGRSLAAICPTEGRCFAVSFSFSDKVMEFSAQTGDIIREISVPEPTGIIRHSNGDLYVASLSSQKKLFRIRKDEHEAVEISCNIRFVSALAWFQQDSQFLALHKSSSSEGQAVSLFDPDDLEHPKQTAELPFKHQAGKLLVLPDSRIAVSAGEEGVHILTLGENSVKKVHTIDGLKCAGGLALVNLQMKL